MAFISDGRILISRAFTGHYALPSFNVCSLEMARACVLALQPYPLILGSVNNSCFNNEKERKKCCRIQEVGHGSPSSRSSRTRSSTKSRIGLLPSRRCLLPRPASRLASSGRFGTILTMRMPSPPFAQWSRVPGAISNSRANCAGMVI
jgi:hypothetical protein